MKVTRLLLRNFRLFDDFEITFDDRMTVIVGVNGSGKTTVMDALAIALGAAFAAFDSLTGTTIRKSDARLQSYIIGSASEDVQSQYPVHVSACALCDEREVCWGRSLNGDSRRTTSKDAYDFIDIFKSYLARLRKGDANVSLPMMAYYGTGRLWDYHREKKTNVFKADKRIHGYLDALDGTANIKLMLNWFRKQTIEKHERLEVGETVSPALDVVYTAMQACYAQATNHKDVHIRYSLNTNALVVHYTDEDNHRMRIPLDQMADGFKTTLSLVADIAYRMAILNPQLGVDVIKNTSGIVLIDEVDLHLHPGWQQRILGHLQTIFPKIQFIVTTHAPAVIHSISSEHLRIIKNNRIDMPPLETYGKDANGILRTVMEVMQRPEPIMKRFQSFYNALDDEDYETAQRVLNVLENEIGSDPEIESCRVQLDLAKI